MTMIAIMGTVLAGVAMSTSSTTEAVTGYEYVTDVSGLFSYNQTPQFVEYNPADNWTGFYNTSTPDNSATYGISYSANPVANLYPVHQAATISSSSFTVSEGSGVDQVNDKLIMANYYSSEVRQGYAPINKDRSMTVYLSDVIDAIVGSSSTIVKIIFTQGTYTDAMPVILKIDGYSSSYPQAYYYDVVEGQTFDVDTDRDICTARNSDGSIAWQAGTRDVMVLRNAPIRDLSGDDTGRTILSTGTCSVHTQDPPTYMDISQGVDITNDCYWVNGYQNSRIDILFHSGEGIEHATFSINPEYMNGAGSLAFNQLKVNLDQSSEGIMTGKVTITRYGNSSIYPTDIGKWNDVIVSIDLRQGSVTFVPVTRFASFTDYDVSQKVIASSASGTFVTGMVFKSINWTAQTYNNSIQLGVVRTDVFMNTYDSVMTSPTITITEQFPELIDSGFRLNFYSFIQIGNASQTITINNQSFEAKNNQIYIGNRWHELNNLAVNYTPQNGTNQVSIVLLNENDWTWKLGDIETYNVSFTGYWTFTTGLWEGYQTTVEKTEFDFTSFVFDGNQAILMFMAILCIGTALCARYYGMGIFDYLVVFFAGLCGFVLIAV